MRMVAVLIALSVFAPVLRADDVKRSSSRRPAHHPSNSSPALDTAADTVALQVSLDRVGFSPGEIDGKPGANLTRAIAAFQSAEGLESSGELDAATSQRLAERSGGKPPLASYTVTDADLAGPFTPKIPADLEAQSTLDTLGYQTPLEALGERFHASPVLLTALNPGVSLSAPGDTLLVPNVSTSAPDGTPGAVIVIVTKGTSALTLEDEAHHVIFHAPVTSGSQHDPLPIGTWKVNGVQQNPVFSYNPALFWDANPAHSKAKLPPGPNNPVGTVWIDLSKEHYGIHGTPEPSKIGHVESHGCVRLTNWDAQRVAALVKPGTRVIFR
jgi:lipoprotein-anchoring transpeptidase ErfK/SrfK